jgi:hypothetical protein
MSRCSGYRWSALALTPVALLAGLAVVLVAVAEAVPAPAVGGSTRMTVKVTPSHGLVNGQTVVVSGRGLARSQGGDSLTWFATECTASVRGHMNPATDTPHCNVTDAQAIRVSANGSFSTRFRVHTGIVGDGYCGTPGHASCVIGVGTASGLGTVVKISFAAPAAT